MQVPRVMQKNQESPYKRNQSSASANVLQLYILGLKLLQEQSLYLYLHTGLYWCDNTNRNIV